LSLGLRLNLGLRLSISGELLIGLLGGLVSWLFWLVCLLIGLISVFIRLISRLLILSIGILSVRVRLVSRLLWLSVRILCIRIRLVIRVRGLRLGVRIRGDHSSVHALISGRLILFLLLLWVGILILLFLRLKRITTGRLLTTFECLEDGTSFVHAVLTSLRPFFC
jgi:hypothetical protein